MDIVVFGGIPTVSCGGAACWAEGDSVPPLPLVGDLERSRNSSILDGEHCHETQAFFLVSSMDGLVAASPIWPQCRAAYTFAPWTIATVRMYRVKGRLECTVVAHARLLRYQLVQIGFFVGGRIARLLPTDPSRTTSSCIVRTKQCVDHTARATGFVYM